MLDPVYFLVGAERSGTTLLRLMLDHHPKVAFASEFEYSVDRITTSKWPSTRRYIAWLRNDRVFTLDGWYADPTKSYPELVNSFLEQKRGDKPIIGATVHRYYSRLLRIWPRARFIYLVRDGRDVAKSRVAKGWDGNMFTAVDSWIEAEESWKALRNQLSGDRWMEVQYADLIIQTTPTLIRICRFLGTDFDEAMYSYPSDSPYPLPDPTKVTQWNHSLSNEEIQLAESKIAPLLLERGFPLSGLPILPISTASALHLAMQSRLKRLEHRIHDFGIWLTVLETLSRRLCLQPIHRAATRRINANINARL